MIRPLFSIAVTAILLTIPFSLPANAAEETTGQVTVSTTDAAAPKEPALSPAEAAKKKKELKLYTNFASFSESLVHRLNAMHSEGRSNMIVVQDGEKFRARYHLIEKKSSVIRESPSRPGQYTGILRYQDTIYQAEGDTETASRNGDFSPVPDTAHAFSEIFQWMKGAWR